MTFKEYKSELSLYEVEGEPFTYTTARAAIIATLPGLPFETALFSIWKRKDGSELWFCNGKPAPF